MCAIFKIRSMRWTGYVLAGGALLAIVLGTWSAPCAQAGVTHVYWAEGSYPGKIRRAEADGTNLTDIITNTDVPVDVAIDPVAEKIYYTPAGDRTVERADYDGSNREVLLNLAGGAGYTRQIELDVAGGKMYWAQGHPSDPNLRSIQRANLDGNGRETLWVGTNPDGLTLDVAGGKMYFCDHQSGTLRRANLDGSSPEIVLGTGISLYKLALDLRADQRKVYWTDATAGAVQRCNLDGSGVETVISGVSSPFGVFIDVFTDQVYWTGNGAVRRRQLSGGAVENVVTGSGSSLRDFELLRSNVYSERVLDLTDPVLYYTMEETPGNTHALDMAPGSGGANHALADRDAKFGWGHPGARPSDGTGLSGMDPENGSLRVNETALVYDQLTTTAGVDTTAYSAQVWFNSAVPFTDNVLNYVFGRGDSSPIPTNRDFVGVGGSYANRPEWRDKLFAIAADEIGVGSTLLSEDTWYHMVFVRSGSDVEVYLNGELEISMTNVPWSGVDGEMLTFGGRTNYEATDWLSLDGYIDEAAVWGRALSPGEVRALYQYAIPEPSSSLLVVLGLIGLAAAGYRRRAAGG